VNAKNAMRTTMAAAAAGMFVLLVILSYFKDVVRSKEEADQKLNCWCLSEIRHERKRYSFKDLMHRKKRGILITNPETGFRYVATMSKLRRRVEQHMKNGKVLMVTSVLENEGKSTVAANLALAMAKKYSKVLLVDLDLHKPACRKILDQAEPEFWTHDVISGKVSLAEAVKTDKLSRMDVLMARHCVPQEADGFIHSSGLPAMLDEARKLYDFVVIDLPPMAIVPDPEAVMEYVDGSLLVIRQNRVTAVDLNRAIGDLQRGKAKMLGCVLNNVHSTQLLSGEGYGTGYGRYGRYGGYGRYGRYAAYAQNSSEK
jgi:capsular exopolysaccharide synthesis family protein